MVWSVLRKGFLVGSNVFFFFFFEEKILRNREFREVILDDFGGIGIRWYRVLRLESTRIRNCDL